ncbi:MAG TPA: hypothetical protein VFP21_13010 [Solirubrobacterales bacterium]|nr:hypothetical protein [Solirubrobacterales bacterium]
MASVFLSAALTCFAALFLGQAALRLAGAREWNWLAPAVGLSVSMLLAAPTVHVPGRATTMGILLALLALAAAVWCLRSPPHRPPLTDLLAALPVVFLVTVPFLAVDRGGILGVTVNNDMTVHLAFVESILHPSIAEVFPLPKDYPLGPHNSAALLSRGLGIGPDLAFSGWTMAAPIIGAWTVLAAARNAAWYGKAIAATVAGMPYLVAAYYGQGSFKEVAQAALVLAVVLCVSGCGPRLGRGRWVPLALLVGGVVSAYSPAGLTWVVAIFGLWLAGLLAIAAWRRQLREVPGVVRRELPALGIGAAVLVVFLLPQAHRMYEFVALREGTGIATSDIGNLVTRLPGWEALGIWDSGDYRFLASEAFVGGVWSWFVVALILFGTYWAVRRGRWLLPLVAVAAMLIWKYSDHTQSIYVAAKALVIASPLILLVAVLPLLDREEKPWPRRPRWAWLAVPLLILILFFQVGADDLRALRFSPVGPTGHARQLKSFHPFIADKKTLFFGEDEFNIWELAGSRFRPISLGTVPQVELRPQKEWEFGHANDFDSVPASTLNEYEWFITTRDAAGSEPPPQVRLVRATEDFELWKRTGRVRERSILNEGEWPGATFRCDTKTGRAILRRGGVAAIKPLTIVAPVDGAGAGQTVSVQLDLPAGTWDLESPYVSHLPVEVTAPGLKTTLPANLDRPGPRLPVGRITVERRQKVTVSFHVEDTLLASATDTATFGYLVATRADAHDEIVPIDRACGRYVDWYRSAGR